MKRLYFIIFVILASTILIAQKNVEKSFKSGLNNFKLGKYESALKDFSKSIKINPSNIEAYKYRGIVKDTMKLYKEAINDYTLAIKMDSTNAELYFLRGNSYLKIKNNDSANINYSKAIDNNKSYSYAYLKRSGTNHSKIMDIGDLLYILFNELSDTNIINEARNSLSKKYNIYDDKNILDELYKISIFCRENGLDAKLFKSGYKLYNSELSSYKWNQSLTANLLSNNYIQLGNIYLTKSNIKGLIQGETKQKGNYLTTGQSEFRGFEGLKSISDYATFSILKIDINEDTYLLYPILKNETNRIADTPTKNEDEEFLRNNKNMPGVVTLPSGLQYKRLNHSGNNNRPSLTSSVKFLCECKFIDGRVFYSSYDRNQASFVLLSHLILGLQEGLQLMSVDDKYEFYIPSKLAYGEEGTGNIVKPNATLLYVVELLEIL